MGAPRTTTGLGAALGSVVVEQLAGLDPGLRHCTAGQCCSLVWPPWRGQFPTEAPAAGSRSTQSFARIQTRPRWLVPFAFRSIDCVTAGYFALTDVAYCKDAFGVDAATPGFTLALFFVPFAVFQYPVGSLSDRIGRFLPVVGSMLYGVPIIAVVHTPRYGFAAGLMGLVGICGTLVSPTTITLITERYGSLPAFLAADGLEITIVVLASREVWRITASGRGPSSGVRTDYGSKQSDEWTGMHC